MFSINCQFKITNKFINAERYFIYIYIPVTATTIANIIWKLIQNCIKTGINKCMKKNSTERENCKNPGHKKVS